MNGIRIVALTSAVLAIGCGVGVDETDQGELAMSKQASTAVWTGHHQGDHYWEDYLPNPCTGNLIDLHIFHRVVGHLTELENGSYQYTENNVVSADYQDGAVSYTGRANIQYGEVQMSKSFVAKFRFSLRMKGSDGSSSTLEATERVVVDANGKIAVEFGEFTATCN